MKFAIPWILVVALLGGGYLLFSSNNEKSAQIAKLTQQTTELETLRAENEELKKIPAQNDEIARLKKDNAELLRLRAESAQLHRQIKDLTTQLAQAQAQGNQAQLAQQKLAGENQALQSQAQKLQQSATRTPAQEQANGCIYNLRLIETAKQQWAVENKKGADATPTAADLAPFFPANLQIVCPAGGAYSVNSIGVLATCSVAGHAIPTAAK
jgi:hypothetical protein